MRNFIRHPSCIPIEFGSCSAGIRALASNVSVGGLAFDSDHQVNPGDVVALKIATVSPVFEASAQVMWCKPKNTGFELGVAFLDQEDAFRARMVEQICHIENYKEQVQQTEHRELSSEEAAHEWISKFADEFPDPEADSVH